MAASSDLSVSVITVCYNSAATLARTISSVADQVWSRVEHIVVDGGSTDGTLAVIDGFRPRLAHVLSEPDEGIYDAMNKGLALAAGDVVAFLNSDDHYVDAGVLARVCRAMADSDLDAAFGDVAYFRAEAPQRIVRRYNSGRFHPGLLAYGWMPAHPALFVRRAVFDRVGRFRTDYSIAGDFEFIVRAFGDGRLKYAYLPEVLVHMCLGGISTAGWRSRVLLNREILRACRANGISTNILKIYAKYPLKVLELWRR